MSAVYLCTGVAEGGYYCLDPHAYCRVFLTRTSLPGYSVCHICHAISIWWQILSVQINPLLPIECGATAPTITFSCGRLPGDPFYQPFQLCILQPLASLINKGKLITTLLSSVSMSHSVSCVEYAWTGKHSPGDELSVRSIVAYKKVCSPISVHRGRASVWGRTQTHVLLLFLGNKM